MATRRRTAKRKSNTTSRSFWIVVIALMLTVATYWLQNGGTALVTVNTGTLPALAGNEIRVCFLDVDQGDSILIQTAEHNVLIDTGEYSERNALLSYLREAQVSTLDILIATHPHSDHIGSMTEVLENVTVKEVVMPDAASNTTTFENFLQMIEDQNIPLTIAAAGDTLNAGLIRLNALAPAAGADLDSDLNNASLVLRMVHGDTAFLFTGDAEEDSEEMMLASGQNLRASILKAGHHGSRTSSSEAFLDAVQPSVVVISCGADNSYGHPHEEMLARLAARPYITGVYRTDEQGPIVMVSDGTEINLYVDDN